MARESTPLLSGSTVISASPARGPPTKATPLPKVQVAVLAAIRLLDPLALFVVLPLAPRMVRDFRPDLAETEIGYLSGWIETRHAARRTLG